MKGLYLSKRTNINYQNTDFNVVEFDHFRMNTVMQSFVESPVCWITKINAVLIQLNKMAITQMKSLISVGGLQKRLGQ